MLLSWLWCLQPGHPIERCSNLPPGYLESPSSASCSGMSWSSTGTEPVNVAIFYSKRLIFSFLLTLQLWTLSLPHQYKFQTPQTFSNAHLPLNFLDSFKWAWSLHLNQYFWSHHFMIFTLFFFNTSSVLTYILPFSYYLSFLIFQNCKNNRYFRSIISLNPCNKPMRFIDEKMNTHKS